MRALKSLSRYWEQLKVAYYSFRKRKITFLELKFKPNRSFVLGHLSLQLLRDMILTLIILEKNVRSLENIKYNRPSARRGLETRLS